MNKAYAAFVFVMGLSASSASFAGESGTVDMMVAGDIEWSGVDVRGFFLETTVVNDSYGSVPGWRPIPKLMSYERYEKAKAENGSTYRALDAAAKALAGGSGSADLLAYHFTAEPLNIEFASDSDRARYPFRKIAPLLGDADFTFANLESPLSDTAEMSGLFRTPTAFADGMKFGGIDVVSIANNHMLDASRQGLADTMCTLDEAGIAYVGGGKGLNEARQPVILEGNGLRIGLLAYTQSENNGNESFAAPGRPGVMPLDPLLIKQDIRRLEERVDLVALSFHWGIYHLTGGAEAGQSIHPAAVEFAHEMIDAGADMILGHHPHFPRAIEVYEGKPIFYSLSHLIFSFTQPDWIDNYIAKLRMTKDQVTEIKIYPVAGQGEELQQPYQLTGTRAENVLNRLAQRSSELGTEVEIRDGVGFIEIQ